MEKVKDTNPWGSCWVKGLIVVLSVTLVWQLITLVSDYSDQLKQQKHAEEQFTPVLKKMDKEVTATADTYDIDKTIKVIYQIDQAVERSDDLDTYLMTVAKQDYRNVHPEVLHARSGILKILMKLYGKQVALEDQKSMWEFTKGLLLATGSSVDASVGANPGILSLEYDKEEMRNYFNQLKKEEAIRKNLRKDIQELESQLLSALFDYSKVYYKYIEEWDRLCLYRDKAYLAAYDGNWSAVMENSDEAIDMAPYEREAHILKAMAMVETMPDVRTTISDTETVPSPDLEVLELLNEYIDENPGNSAPALLLKGVYYNKTGDFDKAKLNLGQASVYYPDQSDALLDMLNPYRMRAYLRKSREGNYILELYKATMLGAGYFSPDLQLARIYYDMGDVEAGNKKVLDHFSRRRSQNQWDYIINDIAYCERYLSPWFDLIMPKDYFLTLDVNAASTLGIDSKKKIKLGVQNNSDIRLNNASLILCLQFTDMHRDDYHTIKVSESLPAIMPGELNAFGTETIEFDWFGETKTAQDVVTHRAILISNEVVTWVDTDDFKFDRLRRMKQFTDMPVDSSLAVFGLSKEELTKAIKEESDIKVSFDLTKFNISSLTTPHTVDIDLPDELSILKPVFRMMNEEKSNDLLPPLSSSIGNENIEVQFEVSGLTEKQGQKQEIKTYIYNKYQNIIVTWEGNAKEGFTVKDVAFE